MPSSLPSISPTTNEAITKSVIQGKYTELTANAYGKLMVAPNKTIPICNGIVPTRRVINVVGGFKKYAKRIPANIDKAALPIKRQARTSNTNVK